MAAVKCILSLPVSSLVAGEVAAIEATITSSLDSVALAIDAAVALAPFLKMAYMWTVSTRANCTANHEHC